MTTTPVTDPALLTRILGCTAYTTLFAVLDRPLDGPRPDKRSKRWWQQEKIAPERFEIRVAPPEIDTVSGITVRSTFEVTISRHRDDVRVLLNPDGTIRATFPRDRNDAETAWIELFGALRLSDETLDFVQSFGDAMARDATVDDVLVELLDSGVLTRENMTQALATVQERWRAEEL